MSFITIFYGLILLLTLFVSKTIIKAKLRKRHYQNASLLNGCCPAPTIHSTNLLGTSVLKESIKATKEDRGPQFVVNTMNSISPNTHTVRVPVFNYEMLVSRDPQNVQAVFATKSGDWDISPLRAKAFMPLLGDGIFTARGERWKYSRMLVRPQFGQEQISNLSLFESHVKVLLDVLRRQDAEGGWTQKLDLQPLFFYFTIDVATEFLYGRSVSSLTAAASGNSGINAIDGKRFSENFNEAKHLVDKRGALQKFHWLMPMKKMNKVCKEIHDVIDKLIEERLAVSDKKEQSKKFVLLDELAKLTNDRLEMRRETLHVLMAGRDPAGSLLGWVFYFLARYKEVFEELRSAVMADFGTIGSDKITHAGLRQCSYLQWVMNEAMRVTAVIPMNERTALRDTILPTGGGEDGRQQIFVLEGTQILIPQYALQHRSDIWGNDVEEFRPDRWEGRKSGWEWIPFGAGSRKCLGQQFALAEVGYTVVRMLQEFDGIENLEEGDGEIKLHTAIENRSGTGVQVRFHRASIT